MNPPSDLAGVPTDAEVPRIVAALPGGDRAEAVWLNGEGGLTFKLPGQHVKWQRGDSPDLAAEAARLRWASAFVTVPPVTSFAREGGEQLLITKTIPGTSAVLTPWSERPREAARALGAGLRAFHDALPVADCPWVWSNRDRLARVRDVRERERLAAMEPGIDQLVVCHGDACAPNTLLRGGRDGGGGGGGYDGVGDGGAGEGARDCDGDAGGDGHGGGGGDGVGDGGDDGGEVAVGHVDGVGDGGAGEGARDCDGDAGGDGHGGVGDGVDDGGGVGDGDEDGDGVAVAVGHVDLGDLGVADRWADLAVLAMSAEWNYGEGYEGDVYAGYGVEPDPARIAFYRDLWNAE